MKTLAELLDRHNITAAADRLEFEEVVNEVTRQHGDALQAAQLKHDASVTAIYEQANAEIETLTKERDALQADLNATREKTSLAVKTASEAINDTSLDDKATLAVVSAVLSDVTKDDRQRQREALAATIAAQQAELAELEKL